MLRQQASIPVIAAFVYYPGRNGGPSLVHTGSNPLHMLMCFSFRFGTGKGTGPCAYADGVVVAIIPNAPIANAAKIADTATNFVVLFLFIFSTYDIIYIFELRKLILVCYCRFI
jgi:hypothetical protein